MKTLYLHVGMQKTATSAIQKFLYDNRELLLSRGYKYDRMPYVYPGYARERNATFLYKYIFDADGKPDHNAINERREAGLEKVAEWFETADNVILTDETLWLMISREKRNPLPRLVEFAKEQDAQIKVIVYIRKQDDYFESLYKQHVKEGLAIPWDQAIADPGKLSIYLDLEANLKRIEEAVGRENVVVRKFDRSLFEGNGNTVQSDFMLQLGLEMTDEYVLREDEVNKSLDNNYTEIRRIMNYLKPEFPDPDRSIQKGIVAAAVKCQECRGRNDKASLFSAETRREFMDRYAEGNKAVAMRYFDSEELFAPGADKAEWQRDDREIMEDAILLFSMLGLPTWIEGNFGKKKEPPKEEVKKKDSLGKRAIRKARTIIQK